MYMRTKFSLRQMKYRANRIAGMNQYNSARAAGYSEQYSLKQTRKIGTVVKSSILNELERAGLTDKYQAELLFKLTKSKKDETKGRTLDQVAKIKGQHHNKIEHLGLPSSENKIIIIRGDIGTESKTPAVSGQVRI